MVEFGPLRAKGRLEGVYTTLEYGRSDLQCLLNSSAFLKESQVRAIMFSLLEGVRDLHHSRVIHRDLKPANVLVEADCSVKICDLGMARTLDDPLSTLDTENSEESRQLSPHVVSRHYRAPEVLLTQDYGETIDIWSVGCILADLLGMLKSVNVLPSMRKPLFKGGSSHLLSPTGDEPQKDD